MRILKYLRERYGSLGRKKSVLLRSGGVVLGIMDDPHRPRKSGLAEADYLLATGGQRLPDGDINYPIDPEMMHSQYNWTILPEARRLLQDDWLPDTYQARVLQQLKLFTTHLDGCPSKASVGSMHEELRTAAFEALKRLALLIRELEHPQRDDSADV